MIRTGIVVQRYGSDVVGGAETLARDVAEKLNASGFDVTVFTTCARDYVTWKNHYTAGESCLKGVRILRYPVQTERNIDTFNEYSRDFFNLPADQRDEMEWIRLQGPDSPELIAGLQEEQKNIDVFIFFTYLYSSTVFGMEAVRKPVLLFPTAHDEPPLHLNVMQRVFNRPDRLLFLTRAEQNMVSAFFNRSSGLELVRTGIVVPEKVDADFFRRRYLLYAPYMLYAGRIEKGKGMETVFEAFLDLRRKRLLQLVLLGKKLMDIPDVDDIRYMGFVSEQEKLSAFRGALFSVQPSPMESLSITTLESFGQKTPVLVNRQCRVLEEHVELSGGGLAFSSPGELVSQAQTLCDSRKYRNRLGQKGHEYVRTLFSWKTVLENMSRIIHSLV